MSNNKMSVAWVIGIVITIVLAVSGWAFGGLQTANAQTHDQIIERVRTNEIDIKDVKLLVVTLITKMDILIEQNNKLLGNK